MRFQPYRRPPPKKLTPEQAARAERLYETTRMVARQLEANVLAMDIYPDGRITIRTTDSNVWELTIQRSDATKTRGEYDLEQRVREMKEKP